MPRDSARLQAGGNVGGRCREQLEPELRPLLRRGEQVWLLADNTYYRRVEWIGAACYSLADRVADSVRFVVTKRG